jgi:hypothetical protein
MTTKSINYANYPYFLILYVILFTQTSLKKYIRIIIQAE